MLGAQQQTGWSAGAPVEQAAPRIRQKDLGRGEAGEGLPGEKGNAGEAGRPRKPSTETQDVKRATRPLLAAPRPARCGVGEPLAGETCEHVGFPLYMSQLSVSTQSPVNSSSWGLIYTSQHLSTGRPRVFRLCCAKNPSRQRRQKSPQ